MTRADVLLRLSTVTSAVTLVLSIVLVGELHARDAEIAALRGNLDHGAAGRVVPHRPVLVDAYRLHVPETVLPAALSRFGDR